MSKEYACVYHDNGLCKKFSEPGVKSYCVLGPCEHETPSNADRIRAMTDEELADFFFESPEIEFEVCEYCENFGGHHSDFPCLAEHGRCFIPDKNEAFKKWLQQPWGGADHE